MSRKPLIHKGWRARAPTKAWWRLKRCDNPPTIRSFMSGPRGTYAAQAYLYVICDCLCYTHHRVCWFKAMLS